jgi:hypothetical protein
VRSLGIVETVALGLLALAVGACRVTREDTPAGLAHAQPVQLDAGRSWAVVCGGSERGSVLELVAEALPGVPRGRCFSVRNKLGQELGRIDGLGRAWRHELFESEPAWVASGTIAEGARAILRCESEVELVERVR